jgi:hypothetical protein
VELEKKEDRGRDGSRKRQWTFFPCSSNKDGGGRYFLGEMDREAF